MENESQPKAGSRKLSIGKKHTESGIVAELLTLLETVTADGTISENEAQRLHSWLESNKNDVSLPGIEFLRTTVTHILADGKVTPEEKTALYKAVEKVLPPEARRGAKERRAAVESIEKERRRASKEAEHESDRIERARNAPVAEANFMVAGVGHENRARSVARFAKENDPVHLVREPSNTHDANAIEVRLRTGHQIGYVPREYALDLAPHLDNGHLHQAYITKILKGREIPTPVVQVYLYRSDANRPEAFSQSDAPARKALAGGCSSCMTLLAGLFGLMVFLIYLLLG